MCPYRLMRTVHPAPPNVLRCCAGAVFILSYCRSEIAPRYEVAKAELLSG